jgi:multidrug transporter EmrE-like cation transporter
MNIKILLLIATIVALTPVILIKQYTKTQNKNLLIVVAILYFILAYTYIQIFRVSEVSKSYSLLQVLQILLVVILGTLLFKEKITQNKIIGVVAGMIAVYYLMK